MVKIITDSVAGIPAEVAHERDLEVVSLYVHHDGVEYVDATMDVDKFYSRIGTMIENPPTSSQPSLASFEDAFERVASEGEDLLGIFVSSGFSGTFNGAVRAARAVKSHHIDFRCVLIDSTSIAFDEAFAVLDALDVRDAGGDLRACAIAALRGIMSSRILFLPETLSFLKAGGRIGGASAFLGSLVQIYPIITVYNGGASPYSKVRTYKKALAKMVSIMENDIEAHGLKRIAVHYIGEKAPAQTFSADMVEHLVDFPVPVLPVSPVLGTHVGPALGLVYECQEVLEHKFDDDLVDRVFVIE